MLGTVFVVVGIEGEEEDDTGDSVLVAPCVDETISVVVGIEEDVGASVLVVGAPSVDVTGTTVVVGLLWVVADSVVVVDEDIRTVKCMPLRQCEKSIFEHTKHRYDPSAWLSEIIDVAGESLLMRVKPLMELGHVNASHICAPDPSHSYI